MADSRPLWLPGSYCVVSAEDNRQGFGADIVPQPGTALGVSMEADAKVKCVELRPIYILRQQPGD